MENKENPFIECACGCGQLRPQYTTEGRRIRWDRPQKYIKGHFFNDNLNRLQISTRQSGTNNSFYGKKHTLETIEKLKKDRKGKTYIDIFGEEKAKEMSIRLSESRKREWKDSKSGYNTSIKGKTYEEIMGKEKSDALKRLRAISSRNINLGKKRTEYSKTKQSLSMKEKWQDEEYREKVLRLQSLGRYKKPTSFEKKISELCIDYHLPFIYTGNGTFLIGSKNPDFINKEKRIAIEVYATWYKKITFGSCEKYEKDRIKYFAKYGYKIIFIREDEIMNSNWEEICVNKINREIKDGF